MTTCLTPPKTPEDVDRARLLRHTQSDSEALLWDRLRAHRLNGVKFRRQFPVPPYTLDFYAAKKRVAVELDGEHHRERKQADEVRDETLRQMGIVTVRVTTEELYGNLTGVLEKILRAVSGR